MNKLHYYYLEIIDGSFKRHGFSVEARNRFEALRIVLQSFNENDCGIPEWLQDHGIEKINIRLLTIREKIRFMEVMSNEAE